MAEATPAQGGTSGKATTPTPAVLNKGARAFQRWDLDVSVKRVYHLNLTVLPGLVREEASLCHLMSHPAQDKSCIFHRVPPVPPGMLCTLWHSSLEPVHCWGARGGTLQLANSSLGQFRRSWFIFSSLQKRPACNTSQNLYAGNCETVCLQKLGLVMSFLTADPCMCHSRGWGIRAVSRAVHTVSSSVSQDLDAAGLNNDVSTC